MTDHDAILKQLFRVTLPSRLADNLQITRQAVHQWRKVPVKRAKDIERLTGIPREELRPDIFGD